MFSLVSNISFTLLHILRKDFTTKCLLLDKESFDNMEAL